MNAPGRTDYSLFTTCSDKFPMVYESAEEFVYKAGYVCPPSWLYRSEAWPKTSIPSLDGTFVLFTHFMMSGKVVALPDVTTTYRKLPESASHSQDLGKLLKRARSIYDTQCRLIDHYGMNQDLKGKCKERYYRRHLASFIVGDAKDELVEYRNCIKTRGYKEKILLLLSATKPGVLLLKSVHRLNMRLKANK